MTQLTLKGEFTIALEEGIVPARYRDKAGVWTWGVGHTAAAGAPNPMNMSPAMPTNLDVVVREALLLFRQDLEKYIAEVVERFGPMKPHELDGWVSWHFNTGGAFTSSAVKHWCNGDKARAVEIMESWNKVTVDGVKRISPALRRRRAVEGAIILGNIYPGDKAIPVWGTNGKGMVIWRTVDTVTFDEYQKYVGVQRPVLDTSVAVGGGIAAIIAALAAYWERIEAWITNLL